SSAAVLQHAFRIDQSCDRVAEFGFVVADAVAADDGASGFDHFRKPTGKNSLKDFEVAFFRKANESKGGERASAHRVNVAQRVCGRDLAESVGIVNDWREEIDGLHESLVGCDFIHSGVVGVVEADYNVRVDRKSVV